MCACNLDVEDHHAPSTATDENLQSNGYATLRRYTYSPVCHFLSVRSPATNPTSDDVIVYLADKLSVATQVSKYHTLTIIYSQQTTAATGRWNVYVFGEQSPVRIPNQATGRYGVFRGVSQCLQAIVGTL